MCPSASSSYIVLLLLLETSFECVLSTTPSNEGIIYRDLNATQDGRTVRLGALFPTHMFGPSQEDPCGTVRLTAIQLVEAMVYATRLINEDPTLLPNITLTFDIRDTCTTVNYALLQSVGYIQDINGVCNNQETLATSGVLGAALSSISQAAARLLGLFEIPQISYASTSPLLSDGEEFAYFFRTIPSDTFQSRALADLVAHFEWRYITLLYSDDLYGRGGIAEFIRELEAKNFTMTCIAAEIVLNTDQSNYEDAVDQMSQAWVSNASVALLFGHTQNAVGILDVIQRRINSDNSFPLQNITWIGSDSWAVSLPDDYRPMARGMLGIVPLANVHSGFTEYFTSLNPTNNTENPWFVEFWESQFSCNLGLSPSLPNCDLDNQTLAPIFEQSRQVPLVLDAMYALAYSIAELIEKYCSNGTLCSEITTTGGAVDGGMLREELFKVNFTSNAQGRVRFDRNGDVQRAGFTVFNLQETSDNDFSFMKVGSWDDENLLSVNTENIMWNTGQDVPTSSCSFPCRPSEVVRFVPDQAICCFTCETCTGMTISSEGDCKTCESGTIPNQNRTTCEIIPLSFLQWSDPWGISISVFTSVGMIATGIVILVFILNFKHEIIKASSRELSAILLGGIMVCFIVPFFYIAKPSAAICGIQRFFVGIGFAISFSALLVKTNRIHRIFNDKSPSLKPLLFTSPLVQVLLTFSLIGIQVLISTVWLIAEKPGTTIVVSSTKRELRCRASPYIGFSVFLGYNFLLLIASTYYAFRTRKVPEKYNETKFVNVTLYTICIIWLAFVPIHFATASFGVLFQTVSLVLGVIFSATTTLCCLYISKVIYLFASIKKEDKAKQDDKKSDHSTMPSMNNISTL